MVEQGRLAGSQKAREDDDGDLRLAQDDTSGAGTAVASRIWARHRRAGSGCGGRPGPRVRPGHPYAVVSAGLGALEGPLHGAASGLAQRMPAEVIERGGAAPVVADHLRAGRRIPGLGHRLHPGEDPRAQALFAALTDAPRHAPR
ncbi:citrate/2-methylcitrate synthase [Streptomyces xantholiticus]